MEEPPTGDAVCSALLELKGTLAHAEAYVCGLGVVVTETDDAAERTVTVKVRMEGEAEVVNEGAEVVVAIGAKLRV